jgi:hypothetical protein
VKKNRYFLFAIVIILLTSCTNTGSKLDQGLLTDNPCKVPCWNGLIPGKSTFEDVDQFIKGLNTKEWAGNNTFVDQPGCLVVQIKDKPGTTVRAFVNFHLDQGKLSYIQSFHHSMPKLKQIVGHLGPPEYVEALNIMDQMEVFIR